MKNYINYIFLLINIIILMSCTNNHSESSEHLTIENKNIIDINQNQLLFEDSIFKLYDSLSKIMWSFNDKLNRLENEKNKIKNDSYYLDIESYTQYVFQNRRRLISLDSICDSLKIPTVNFRIFKKIDDAIKFVDTCIYKFNLSNNLKKGNNDSFLNQILADRERLVKMKKKILTGN